MKGNFRRNLKLLYLALGVALLLWPASIRAQNTLSGQATAVGANVSGVQTVISDTGALAPSGDALASDLVSGGVAGLLSTDNAHAAMIGLFDGVDSEASNGGLTLAVAGNTIRADFLMARASASCASGVASAGGSSDVEGLVINGISIDLTGNPNQVVSLPVGTVVINEQAGSPGKIHVNALHVNVPGVANIVISSADAGIGCGGS